MFALLYLFAGGIFYLIAKTLFDWYRLRHIPGPFSAGFSKAWLFKHTWYGSMYLESAEQCFKYGTAQFSLLSFP